MQKKRNKMRAVVDCFEIHFVVKLVRLINLFSNRMLIKQMCHQKIKLCLSLCIAPILFNNCVERKVDEF